MLVGDLDGETPKAGRAKGIDSRKVDDICSKLAGDSRRQFEDAISYIKENDRYAGVFIPALADIYYSPKEYILNKVALHTILVILIAQRDEWASKNLAFVLDAITKGDLF